MSTLFSRGFWAATVERGLKTAAQSALLAIGADQLNVLTLDFATVAGFAGGGLILSVLTSVASATVSPNGPSLGAEITTPVADELVVTAARTGLINETTTRRDLHPRD